MHRACFVEEWVEDVHGGSPTDYKFHVVNHQVAMIQVDASRFKRHTQLVYSPQWERLPVSFNGHMNPDTVSPDAEPPSNLAELLQAAVELSYSGGLPDSLRIDLYTVGKEVYFSEITFTPNAGRSNEIKPNRVDNILGFLLAHPENIDQVVGHWTEYIKE